MEISKFYSKGGLEIVWWLTTAVIIIGVMYPIWRGFPNFSFQWVNIVFIASFVTFARYTFLLEHTFLADKQRLKIGFIALSGLIGLFFMNYLNDWAQYVDQNDTAKILATVTPDERTNLLAYIRSEIVFFGIGSIIGVIALAIRLSVSVWRWHNRKEA